MLGRSFSLLVALGLTASLWAGCGSNERPPPADYGSGGPAVAAGGTDLGFAIDAGLVPPTCGKKPDGTDCDCVDVPLYVDPPTMYFVLDASGSMRAENKWTQVRVVVGKILRSIGPRAKFGAAIFPDPRLKGCAPGREVMSVRDGDPPSSTADGPTTTYLLTVTRIVPEGATPTAITLDTLEPALSALPGRKFAILATDGAPNCNEGLSCAPSECQLNIEGVRGCDAQTNCCASPFGSGFDCNDRAAAVAAARKLERSGVPVYVIGLPGAESYASLLDEMAEAGGTALSGSPKYYAVNAASEEAMLAALKKVAAKITATCVFDLKEPVKDERLVNVYFDDQQIVYEPVNGWVIEGQQVKLVGASCEKVLSGDVLNVRIIAGCPRLEPR